MKKTYKCSLPLDKEVQSVNAYVSDEQLFVDVEFKIHPKDGDFLIDRDGDIFIVSINKNTTSDCYGCYIGTNHGVKDIYYNMISGWVFREGCRFATKQEINTFLTKLEKDFHKRWNPIKKCVEDIYVPKFGDIVKIIPSCAPGSAIVPYMICIWPKEPLDINTYKQGCFDIANIDYANNLRYQCSNGGGPLQVVPASDKEKKKLVDALRDDNKYWNPETMELENIRWKPKEGEKYWFVDTDAKLMVTTFRAASTYDRLRVAANNCFKTKEAAQPYAIQIGNILKSSIA